MSEAEEEPKKKKTKVTFEILGIVLMAVLIVGGFAYSLGVFSKQEAKTSAPPPNPYGDYNPPTGKILKPKTGEVIKAKILDIEIEAKDDKSGVANLDIWVFYLAEKRWEKLTTLTSAPYQYRWDISNLKDQAVTLTIHVFDNARNEARDPGGWQEAILLLPSEVK